MTLFRDQRGGGLPDPGLCGEGAFRLGFAARDGRAEVAESFQSGCPRVRMPRRPERTSGKR